jgi:hypothetical protein
MRGSWFRSRDQRDGLIEDHAVLVDVGVRVKLGRPHDALASAGWSSSLGTLRGG